MQEADLLALPIVDTEERLVGIVTVDDAMRILEEEQTEDVARAGGAEPLDASLPVGVGAGHRTQPASSG